MALRGREGRKEDAEDRVAHREAEEARLHVVDEFVGEGPEVLLDADAEGHEHDVLQGLKSLLNYNEIFLQVEIFEKNFNKINKYLKSQKFKCINAISNDGKTDYYYKNFY